MIQLARVIAILTAALFYMQATASNHADILIENTEVVDVAAGKILARHTVAVQDGRISGIWPASDSPQDVTADLTIDGSGKYLIPGLWDSHVHFRGGEALVEENKALLKHYPLSGVTTVRDGGGDITPHLLQWRTAIDEGKLLGPRIFTSGPKLDGPEPMWDGSIPVGQLDEVATAIDDLQAMGADYVKLYNGSMSAEIYLALIRESESSGIKVMGHMPDDVDIMEAIEAGLDGIDHLDYVYNGVNPKRHLLGQGGSRTEVRQQMTGARDPAREEEVYTAMRDAGTAVVPTLYMAWLVTAYADTDFSESPELAYMPQGILGTYAMRIESARKASAERMAVFRAYIADQPNLIPGINEAGVTILAGSDAGPFNSYCFPGACLKREMQALVAAGMTPAEVLRSATTEPAAFLGYGDSLGKVAVGFEADLVLLDKNPLADIAATESVDTVILRGRTVLDGAALQRAWEEARTSAKTGAGQ